MQRHGQTIGLEPLIFPCALDVLEQQKEVLILLQNDVEAGEI